MGFLEDLGNGLAAAASTVGDIVEGAVDAAADTAENVVDGVCETVQDGINSGTGWLAANGGPILGSIGNAAGGAVVGLIEGGQDLADDALAPTPRPRRDPGFALETRRSAPVGRNS